MIHINSVLAAREVLTVPAVGSDPTEWTGISESYFRSVPAEEVKAKSLDYEMPLGPAPNVDCDNDNDNAPIDEVEFTAFMANYKANASSMTSSDGSVSDVSTDYQPPSQTRALVGEQSDRRWVGKLLQDPTKMRGRRSLPPNTVAPLLCISSHLRQVVLKVLLDATRITRGRNQMCVPVIVPQR